MKLFKPTPAPQFAFTGSVTLETMSMEIELRVPTDPKVATSQPPIVITPHKE